MDFEFDFIFILNLHLLCFYSAFDPGFGTLISTSTKFTRTAPPLTSLLLAAYCLFVVSCLLSFVVQIEMFLNVAPARESTSPSNPHPSLTAPSFPRVLQNNCAPSPRSSNLNRTKDVLSLCRFEATSSSFRALGVASGAPSPKRERKRGGIGTRGRC